jgi:hypothetical protein
MNLHRDLLARSLLSVQRLLTQNRLWAWSLPCPFFRKLRSYDSEKYLPSGSGDVGGELRPRGDAGEMSQARLHGGAEQEELFLLAKAKGGEGGDQAL